MALLTRFPTSSQLAEYCYGSSMLPAGEMVCMNASLETGRTRRPDRITAELREDPTQHVWPIAEQLRMGA